MPLNPGQVLNNRYRIVALLGQGGFGAVYRAWDLNLKGPCAVKENFETDQAAQRQFEREASLLYNLRHPNLPKVIDTFSLPGQGQYLVMEYIEGEDLGAMLERMGKPIPVDRVLPWIDQVCEALGYLHSRTPPVIHRDLKPANIRITPEGQAILVDFGIAKAYDSRRVTTQGARAATPGYAPIEQYGQEPTDARTDIYALGATLYCLLTGAVPLESVARVRGRPLPTPRNLNPAINAPLDAALRKALEVMPEDRYQDMGAFQAALRAVQGPPSGRRPLTGTAQVSSAPLRAAAAPASHPGAQPSGKAGAKSLPWGWIGAVGGLLLVVVVLLVVVFGGGDPGGSELSSAERTQTALALFETRVDPTTFTATESSDFGALMVLIPAGEFQMGSEDGSSDWRPVHAVYLDDFFIDVYEVTNTQFAEFLNARGNREEGGATWLDVNDEDARIQQRDGLWQVDSGYTDHPVVEVTWYGAQAYCDWRGARLPTEAEWEKAARGGLEGMSYPWGDEAPVCTPGASNGAQYSSCDGRTVPVGTFSANGYGLFDMAGNVWEWVADWYDSGYYNISPFENPLGPEKGTSRVLRGGSWYYIGESALRIANRSRGAPADTNYYYGFRCARAP